jgi:NAD(P)-dependent dehydrogenase (short-subunit alcohol dehydrogenase family)
LAYAWSKKGVQLEAAKAAVIWGPRGGRVVSLSPGLIDTPMGRLEFANQPTMKSMVENTPLGRQGRADELAAVAAFLLSDDASYVSGVDLLVDGALGATNATEMS